MSKRAIFLFVSFAAFAVVGTALAGAHAKDIDTPTCNAPERTAHYQAYNDLLCEGIAQLEAGHADAAVHSFEELVSLRIHEAPNYAPLSLMALAYWRNGEAEQAQETLTKAKLSLEVLVRVVECVENHDGLAHLNRGGTRLSGAIAEEIGNLMCGAAYEYIYEQKSLEIVHGDAQLIQRYFDVRDEIKGKR